MCSRYVRRREEPTSARNIGAFGVPIVLSIILDIMDQLKSHVPGHGLQGVLTDPFNKLIVGVKVLVSTI